MTKKEASEWSLIEWDGSIVNDDVQTMVQVLFR
jgi:hypothetical protein